MPKSLLYYPSYSRAGVVHRLVCQPSKLEMGVRFPPPAPWYAPVAQRIRAMGFYPTGRGFDSLPGYHAPSDSKIVVIFAIH
jgi:hypothetical protein